MVLRRRFWVKGDVQGRLVVFYILGCAVLSALMVCFVFGVSWLELGPFVSISGGVDPHGLLWSIFRSALFAAGALFLFSAAAGSLLMVFVSHRVAGPLYRMETMLADPTPPASARLRKGDALQEVFARVCDIHTHNIDLSRRLEALVHALGDACDHADPDDRAVTELREILQDAQRGADPPPEGTAEGPPADATPGEPGGREET